MDEESHHLDALPEIWPALEPERIVPGMRHLNRERARLWALVLTARAVPCILEQNAALRWELRVPEEQTARAAAEIAAYEEKNRGWPPPLPPPRQLAENTLATLSVLLLLATFYNLVRLDPLLPGGLRPDWLAIGSARADRILAGDWWRTITALTLHQDVAHLLGNIGIGGIFVLLLCRELGSGLAWCLVVAAGALGNLVNALVQSGDHSSIGASTAVFATVGILAAITMVRYRQHLQKRWRLPVAAALALLTLLGTEGKNTDLGAHFFGFGSGLLLGLVTEPLLARRGRPSGLLNGLLAIAGGLAVLLAWLAAIVAG